MFASSGGKVRGWVGMRAVRERLLVRTESLLVAWFSDRLSGCSTAS